jgi:hypothetical protein
MVAVAPSCLIITRTRRFSKGASDIIAMIKLPTTGYYVDFIVHKRYNILKCSICAIQSKNKKLKN